MSHRAKSLSCASAKYRDIPTLDQIEEAFSVDAVTEEFFDEYAAFFEKIKGSLTNW